MRAAVLLIMITPTLAAQATKQLPITHVSLYKNGVGFFEASGRVTGTQAISIDFTSAQLNDVLQSLTAVDTAGGRITGAGFNSTTPLDQQLATLALGLPAQTDSDGLFTVLRGTRLEVTGQGAPFTGRLVSIESRTPTATKPNSDDTPKIESRILTVASESGQIRLFALTPTLTVRLLDTPTHTDLTQYLQTLDNNRSAGLRHLTLTDAGSGTRDLHVSYLSEVPVWKSTYRILFTGDKATTATLQGYSVIDNTTGTDWINVHLSLIAGAPQSFIQPISTPYYTRRPEIPLPEEAQLEPQTHDSGESSESRPASPAGASQNSDGTQTSSVSANSIVQLPIIVRNVQTLHGFTGGVPLAKQRDRVSGGVLGQFAVGGIGPGRGGNMGGGIYDGPPPAPIAPGAFQALANQSFDNKATTNAFDDYFAYNLTDPITLLKNQSALVPILQTKLPIERVTLWSAASPNTPALRALWITNSSNLTLDRGSFSIVEDGNFGGEGLLDPIHPAERRLLSYAVDQAVRVTTSKPLFSTHVTRITIAKGVLHQISTDIAEITYDVHNAAPDARSVILEHPVIPGYTLDSDPKPMETTPDVYRFRVNVAPGQTVDLHVGARHPNSESFRLVDRQEPQLLYLLNNAHVSPATLAAFQPAFELHHQILALDTQIKDHENEISSISTDQARLRDNLKSLPASPEAHSLATRYTAELNTQEDRIAQLRTQIATLTQQRATLDAQFQQAIQTISIDETL